MKSALKLRILQHIIVFFIVVLPVRLVGIVICAPLTLFYNIGEFPTLFKWWDDIRARKSAAAAAIYSTCTKGPFCRANFGNGYCSLIESHNKTWFGRYTWTAFKKTADGFQHYVLGKDATLFPSEMTLLVYKGKYFTVEDAYKGSKGEPYAWAYYSCGIFKIKLGYEIGSVSHIEHMSVLNIPLKWTCSINLNTNKLPV